MSQPPRPYDFTAIEHPLERWLRPLASLLPALVAVWNVENIADASHDVGVVRTVGLGYTGGFRAFDALLAAFLIPLPLGTLAFRAAFAQAVFVALIGAILVREIRRTIETVDAAPLLKGIVALIGSLAVTCALPLQIEARSAGGSLLGVLLPLVVLVAVRMNAPVGLVGVALGLASSYEPVSFVFALSLVAPDAVRTFDRERRPEGVPGATLAILFAGWLSGMLPLLIAFVFRQVHGEWSLTEAFFASPLGERGALPSDPLRAFLISTFGPFLLACTLAGAAVAWVDRHRWETSRWSLVALAGLGAVLLGAPAGSSRYSVASLGITVAVGVFSALAILAAVRKIASARIPFAFGSSLLFLLLAIALPVRLLDDTLNRSNAHTRILAGAWDEATWGSVPSRALFLATDSRWFLRALSQRVAGELRGDIELVPLYDLTHRLAAVELYREPTLASIYRDLALGTKPEEWSLTKLAATRGTLLPFPSDWDAGIVKHMVPNGLFVQFEVEPRGMSDRKKALDAFASLRAVLVRANVSGDPELARLTVAAFRSRVALQAESGERELLSKTIEDLRAVSPEDPMIDKIARRMVTTKGPMHITDLLPP